jgi:hypothetical protein
MREKLAVTGADGHKQCNAVALLPLAMPLPEVRSVVAVFALGTFLVLPFSFGLLPFQAGPDMYTSRLWCV